MRFNICFFYSDFRALKIFSVMFINAKNILDTFPHSLPVDGEVANLFPTCYGLVSDTARPNYFDIVRIVCGVAI